MRAADAPLLAQGPGDLHQEEPGRHREQPGGVRGGPGVRGLTLIQIEYEA